MRPMKQPMKVVVTLGYTYGCLNKRKIPSGCGKIKIQKKGGRKYNSDATKRQEIT